MRLLQRFSYPFALEELHGKPNGLTGAEVYALVRFGVLTVKDLTSYQREDLTVFVEQHDVKVCPPLVGFMKPIRQKKIITVYLCLKSYSTNMPKEVIFYILDFCFSPPEFDPKAVKRAL